MRTDGWTEMNKLIVAFRNFANAPENNLTEKVQRPCESTMMWDRRGTCARITAGHVEGQ